MRKPLLSELHIGGEGFPSTLFSIDGHVTQVTELRPTAQQFENLRDFAIAHPASQEHQWTNSRIPQQQSSSGNIEILPELFTKDIFQT
jgi:hypothetical protein